MAKVIDERSISNLLDIIGQKTRKSSITIITHDTQFSEVLLQENYKNLYVLCDLNIFIKTFKHLIITKGDSGTLLNNFVESLRSSKRMTRKDILEMSSMERYHDYLKNR